MARLRHSGGDASRIGRGRERPLRVELTRPQLVLGTTAPAHLAHCASGSFRAHFARTGSNSGTVLRVDSCQACVLSLKRAKIGKNAPVLNNPRGFYGAYPTLFAQRFLVRGAAVSGSRSRPTWGEKDTRQAACSAVRFPD